MSEGQTAQMGDHRYRSVGAAWPWLGGLQFGVPYGFPAGLLTGQTAAVVITPYLISSHPWLAWGDGRRLLWLLRGHLPLLLLRLPHRLDAKVLRLHALAATWLSRAGLGWPRLAWRPKLVWWAGRRRRRGRGTMARGGSNRSNNHRNSHKANHSSHSRAAHLSAEQ